MQRRKIWLHAVLAAAFGMAAPGPAGAAPLEMLHRNWDSQDGLPQDHIRVLLRTSDGFLWMGTDAGLARFDGHSFRIYSLREGLGAVAVLTLLEASDGALWIGTLGGGVSVLRQGRITRTYTREDGLPSATVPTLAEDAEKRIWVAGLCRLVEDRFEPVPGAREAAAGLLRDREGVLWMNTASRKITRWRDGQWQTGSGGGPESAAVFCEDDRGRLWVVDYLGVLWCREAGVWQSRGIPGRTGGRASSLTATADGTVWIAFFRESVIGFRAGEFITPRTGSESFLDLAEAVLATPDGLLWMGTSTHGLFALSPRRISLGFLDQPDGGRGANFIGALIEAGPGEFLVGTQGHGLFRWREGITTPVTELDNLNRGLFGNAFLGMPDGTVWAGTGRGLLHFVKDGDGRLVYQKSRMLSDAWELCRDEGEAFWAGRGDGSLYQIRETPRKVDYGGNRGDPVKGLAREPDGTLWIGTRGNGLFRWKDGESRRFGLADGLASEVIRVVRRGADGALWIGTAGGGLAVRTGERFRSFTTQDGLPDDIVSQIMEDGTGRLWLGTNRGIAVLEKAEVDRMKHGEPVRLHPLVINRADGLVAEECTIVPPVALRDGRTAFATTHGFALLKTEDFQTDRKTPPVFIDSVLADGREISLTGGRLNLPPGLDRLEINYTGIHFAAPRQLRFRSRLGGLEEENSPASPDRRVEYRNLAPGDYRFELEGSAGNGYWTPHPAVLEFTLAPWFWQTFWFKGLAGLSLLGLVAAGVRRRERARSFRKIESLKRAQAILAERSRIARDLHDDVGSSLTQVALLSELAGSDLTGHPERAREHINEIFTTAQDVTRSLDEIVWAVNPAQDTLERFAGFLGTFVQNYARSAGLTARLAIPGELPAVALSPAVRHHLYLATKEVLHNIVKHAAATEVRLRLIPLPKGLQLVIGDNGRGMAADDPDSGDGMGNLVRRLEQIGGTCTHRSSAGQGTTVELTVPLLPH